MTVTTGVALLTVWERDPLPELLLASPLYVAVIGSVPADKVDVLTVAIPLARVTVPRAVEPLVKVTVPVTLMGRVAVKVTD